MIGRNIVGKPMALSDQCQRHGHRPRSRTKDLAAEDPPRRHIPVAAVGKPRFVTADMVKPGRSSSTSANRLRTALRSDRRFWLPKWSGRSRRKRAASAR